MSGRPAAHSNSLPGREMCFRPGSRRSTGTLLVLLLGLFPFFVNAEILDRVVARVNTEVITASELAYTIAFNQRFGSAAARDQQSVEAETLQGLITRRLLVQEARRLRFVEVSDQDVSAEVEKLKNRFESARAFNEFLSGLDMSAQELALMLNERILVERFVEKKVGLAIRVSRDEAQNYFSDHPSEFPGKRFPDVQKLINARLTDQKIGRQLDQYLAELRSKADIRIIVR
jgi:hypothetical protein